MNSIKIKHKYYISKGKIHTLENEPCGGSDKLLVEYTRPSYVIRHGKAVFKDNDFRVYHYTNFYDNKTFSRVY